MNWFHLIKESLSISDIFNNAIPNFYNRVIDIHPDMKEFLDEEANEFRTRYLNYLKNLQAQKILQKRNSLQKYYCFAWKCKSFLTKEKKAQV